MSKVQEFNTQSGNVAAALALTGVDLRSSSKCGVVVSTTVATPAAKTFVSGTAEISTVTTIADTGVCEVQTVTFQTKANSTAGDYVVIEDTLGIKYAVSVDKLGTGIEPTGAIWTAIPSDFTTTCDISAATTAAQVAAAFEIAFNSLRGFTAAITTDDTAANGTMTFTQVKMANVSAVVVKNADDSGAGGITKAETTAGVASNLQNKYFSMYAPDGNAENVFWYNVNSQGTAPTVSGAVINEIAIAKSATANAVASATNTVIDALAGFSSTVATNEVDVTTASKYNTTNLSDTGNTGFTLAVTTPGVNNDFSISANTITIASHGYATGLKVAATTDGTLPTGITATDYWVIKVDSSTIKLATSAANAIAGTAVNITGDGSGTHTLTPAAITGASYKLQLSYDGITFFDIPSASNNVTVTADFVHEFATPTYNYIRLLWAITTGQIAYNVYTNVRD